MSVIIGLALLASGVQEAPQAAQTVPAAAPAPIVARPVNAGLTGTSATLAANTEITVTLNEELNSKKFKKAGHKFNLSVANDVVMGDYVIIPKGTPAFGVVTYRTGKGAFGKSAKIEFDITHLELSGNTIPLKGHFRQEGKGNTGAAVGAVVAVGVFGAFVTGKSAVVEQGREFKVFTAEPLTVQLAGTNATTR